MQILESSIRDVKIIVPTKVQDERGYLSETYRTDVLGKAGLFFQFTQDNHVLSTQKHVVRGLHYQIGQWAQAKLIRVARGAIWDVALDIRRHSVTYGKYVAIELSEENWKQLLVPVGFAHGYVTLEPNTEVIYKLSQVYSPQHERGILWNDPALEIRWPVTPEQAIVSDKDKHLPKFKDAMKFE